MDRIAVPDATVARYQEQAELLLASHQVRVPQAIEFLHHHLPRFLDDRVPWLPRPIADEEIAAASLTIDDARLAVARGYSYRDWDALVTHTESIVEPGSSVRAFELAAEAVITGDETGLVAMLRADPALVRARSARVTCHDPAEHRATLLHYLGANGVEGYRQLSPPNAVAVCRLLIEAGAEPDALAGMYGGQYPVLPMLVSSSPPAAAGVQGPLTEALLDAGAAIEGCGSPQWGSPLLTALVFGFVDTAELLVRRGAKLEGIVAAAGLGKLALVRERLSRAGGEERHRALALAAQLGQALVVEYLLDAGEDPDRCNPDGMHSHATPLHHAAGAGHEAVVRLLVSRGARLDIRDTLWQGTPRGWASHGGHTELAAWLEARGAPDS